MSKPTTNRIFGLDLMRALAILMVLFGHCLWIYPERQDILYQSLQLFGFFGVELFFVLSGFLIGNILFKLFIKEEFTPKTALYFLKRRWFRTLPNYYLVLLINVLVAFLVGYNIPQLWRYFFFLQNIKAPMLPFFPESWSLSVEEFAYILLPLALIILGTVIKKGKSRVYLLAVITLIALSFLAKIDYTYATTNTTLNQWNVALKSVVIYRLDSIYIGVFASWIFNNYQQVWEKAKQISALLGMLLFLFLFFGLAYFGLLIETNPNFWNLLYLPLTSVCVALFLPLLSLWKTEATFIQKPIEFISKISYSIYLLHYSLILYLMKYFVDTISFSKTERLLFTAIYLIIVFILSTLLYRFYEKPMMDLRDKN
ncbi:acyltransferase family protein [Flavobacterium capsici]|uniref:Acyltransferase n=1 Tax=Flavobacterium capsici TaxID=3075618 RepID=A0AA96EVP4_9FLAO|nr:MULTISPECIES: acyltransferase [unclassified Flavobacterium]WNM19041.1 acyltransferase [Flavobacterium sp. PMR2A8]WNM23091.1 acyltransferase [Flavobacterium sp. PMTSA4]